MKRTFRTKQGQGTYFKNGFPNEKNRASTDPQYPQTNSFPFICFPDRT